MMTPSFSVVIPAHDEVLSIERCLRSVLEDARSGELEVIVVCNGCNDGTADAARSVSSTVRVVEIAEASKVRALNVGDALASSYPRFYVDADVEVGTESLRQVASVINAGRALVAAPELLIRLDGCSVWVRAWYRVWLALPYVRSDHVGGAFGVSVEGRTRFGTFPDVIADDAFIGRTFEPHERCIVRGAHTVVRAPKTLRSLIHRRVRVLAGNRQLEGTLPGPQWSLRLIIRPFLRRPRLVPYLPVYLAVAFIARVRARQKLASGRCNVWERDDSRVEAS